MAGIGVINFRRLKLVMFSMAVLGVTSYAQTVVVQPGAPGQPTKVLPADTKPKLTALAPKDVEFMQGMIMHHAQAVEMVELMATRTENKELRLLGARISQSQSDEINFMRRWLALRGEKTEMDHSGHSGHMTMPGMLSKRQMNELAKAKNADFDRLFLLGMIQHHQGALDMVDDLVNTAGTAQDAELFNFITDVDTGQRAEIKLMEQMLERLK